MINLKIQGMYEKYYGKELDISLDNISIFVGDDFELKNSVINALIGIYSVNSYSLQTDDLPSLVAHKLGTVIKRDGYEQLISTIGDSIELEVPFANNIDEKYKKLYYHLYESPKKIETFIILNTLKHLYGVDLSDNLNFKNFEITVSNNKINKSFKRHFDVVDEIKKKANKQDNLEPYEELNEYSLTGKDESTKVIYINDEIVDYLNSNEDEKQSETNDYDLSLNLKEFTKFLVSTENSYNLKDNKDKYLNCVEDIRDIARDNNNELFKLIFDLVKNGQLDSNTLVIFDSLSIFKKPELQEIFSLIIRHINKVLGVDIIINTELQNNIEDIVNGFNDDSILENLSIFKFQSDDEFLYLSYRNDVQKLVDSYKEK